MDLRRLDLRFDEERAEVTVVDATGTRTVALAGEDFARVRLAAAEAVRVATRAVRGPESDPGISVSQADFWQTLYRTKRDGWELMRAAPPLEHWFARHSPAGKRTLVVGCGRGHEARMLAGLGAEVVAVDFAADAIAEAKRLTAPELRIDFRQQDLFTLPEDGERGRYALAVEHTCFCAIDPARQGEYVEVMAQMLAPDGLLVGLFRINGGPGGPPFSVAPDELERLFAPRFELVEQSVPADSVAARQGHELLAVFRPR